MDENHREAPTCLSVCSGIGGMDLGLHRAGFRHVGFAESEPYRRDVLRARFPGVPVYDDIRAVNREVVADGGERVKRDRGPRPNARRDVRAAGLGLVAGGTPCQDLSVAGQRRGLAGDRSGLFFEYARVVDALRPRWLLWENVPGAFSSNGGRDFGVVLGTLADIGYGLAWRLLDSRYFGVPQRRRRVFIVGTLADGDPAGAAGRAGQVLAVGARCPRHPATRGEEGPRVAVASLSGLGDGGPDDNEGQVGRLVASALTASMGQDAGHPGFNGKDERVLQTIAATLSSGSHPGSNMPGRRREDDENLVAGPLGGGNDGAGRRSKDDPNLVVAASVRRLTPTECERLQGLPDGWTQLGGTADSPRYAALGDAVTAHVAQWIGERILQADHPCRTEVKLGTYGRIDILTDARAGIECKVRRNGRLALFMQLHRYANSGYLDSLALITPQDVDWLREAWRRFPQLVPLRIHSLP